jgi:hypothetical protein
MDSSLIYKALYRNFVTHEYKLFNSFIFNWESDFFCQSKSGYYIEVEVKVSRGDFFADFKKRDKHRVLNDTYLKRTHTILRQEGAKGDLLSSVTHKYLKSQFGPQSNSSGRFWNGISSNGWIDGYKNGKHGYWMNDYGRVYLRPVTIQNYAPCTSIQFRNLEKVNCPHQLYYACPEGLIKPEEIPAYAGLYYFDGFNLKVVKKAPYLHKRPMDLTKLLLDKFHNLWKYSVTLDKKIAIQTTLNFNDVPAAR